MSAFGWKKKQDSVTRYLIRNQRSWCNRRLSPFMVQHLRTGSVTAQLLRTCTYLQISQIRLAAWLLVHGCLIVSYYNRQLGSWCMNTIVVSSSISYTISSTVGLIALPFRWMNIINDRLLGDVNVSIFHRSNKITMVQSILIKL